MSIICNQRKNAGFGEEMNSTHLIIKSRTVAAQLQKTNPGAAQRLVRLVERWEALRSAQRKLCAESVIRRFRHESAENKEEHHAG